MIELWGGIALIVVIAAHFGFQYLLKRLARQDEMRRRQRQEADDA